MYSMRRVKAIREVLWNRYTNKQTRCLVVWPQWFHHKHYIILREHGMMYEKCYGPDTYNHTSVFVVPEYVDTWKK